MLNLVTEMLLSRIEVVENVRETFDLSVLPY